jgi:hypothetical protein
MGNTTCISQLHGVAQDIESHADTIDRYLTVNNLALLSFDISAWREVPTALYSSQKGLLEAVDEIMLLVEYVGC